MLMVLMRLEKATTVVDVDGWFTTFEAARQLVQVCAGTKEGRSSCLQLCLKQLQHSLPENVADQSFGAFTCEVSNRQAIHLRRWSVGPIARYALLIQPTNVIIGSRNECCALAFREQARHLHHC